MHKTLLVAITSLSLLISFGPANASTPKDAVELYKQQRSADAVRIFDAHYKETVSNPDTAYYYALSLFDTNQTQRAITICQYIVKAFPASQAATQAKVALENWKQPAPKQPTNATPQDTNPDPSTVGVVGIKFVIDSGRQYPTVSQVFPGTPAYNVLEHGDQITEIDHRSVAGFNKDQLYNVISGKPNTSVSITVTRAGQTYSFSLRRISIAQISKTNPRVGDDYLNHR